jgi:hypothetical protein
MITIEISPYTVVRNRETEITDETCSIFSATIFLVASNSPPLEIRAKIVNPARILAYIPYCSCEIRRTRIGVNIEPISMPTALPENMDRTERNSDAMVSTNISSADI